jgi:hypothetical protein
MPSSCSIWPQDLENIETRIFYRKWQRQKVTTIAHMILWIRLWVFNAIFNNTNYIVVTRFICGQNHWPTTNRQTSGESASLPQSLGCNTVFDMRLRVTFLRQKTVSLQSNIAYHEKYWSLMKVWNRPTLRRMKIYYYWTNIRKWNYFNTSFIEDFRK